MRVGVQIPSFNLTHFLKATLKCVEWMDRIVVTNNSEPWETDKSFPDDTEEICRNANLPNLQFVKVNRKDDAEHHNRNMAMSLLKDMDFVFLIDSDEIMMVEEQKELIKFAQKHPEYDGYGVNTIPYFGDLKHRALYDIGTTPLGLVRPSAKFFTTRCIEGPWIANKQVSIHHMKFLMPLSQIGWRVTAKHPQELRSFGGVVQTDYNEKFATFMKSCGYDNIKGEITADSITSA